MAIAMPCPRCHTCTARRKSHGFASHRCASCEGVWISGISLSLYLRDKPVAPSHAELSALAAKSPPAVRPLRCPTCSKRSFRTFLTRGIEVDMCRHCAGMYLDADEIDSFRSSCITLAKGPPPVTHGGVITDEIGLTLYRILWNLV
jgi:Zn-finger nucleic acid-binding protein